MTKRETRVINAFINCVERGEFSAEYACLLIEDNNKYGYLTDEAKEVFYEAIEANEEENTENIEGIGVINSEITEGAEEFYEYSEDVEAVTDEADTDGNS